MSQLTRMLRQQQQQAAAPDTAAAPADTLTFADRLRSDAMLNGWNDPVRSFSDLIESLRLTLLDPALWTGLLALLLKVLVIAVLAVLAIRLIDRLSGRWMRRVAGLPQNHPRRQRTETISNLISSAARYIIWPIALITILSELDVDVAALIATAGVAGLAIGFGAQTLVKDFISGILLLFDDSLHVGDTVNIGDEAGTVETIGVRLIRVRKLDGEVLMVPAGELRIFGNRSIGYARAIVVVGLSYEQDIEAILPVMQRVADEWADAHRDILLEEEPTVQAITEFGDSSVLTRIMIQVLPGEQWNAERDLRRRLKQAFDELGIDLPFPRHTVYMQETPTPPPRDISDPHGAD